MSTVDDMLSAITSSNTIDEINSALRWFSRQLGYTSHSYVDVRRLPLHDERLPYYTTTVRSDFIKTYAESGFLGYDPVVTRAATTNAPFRWSDCREFQWVHRRRPGQKGRAVQVMELAQDYGYQDGYVIPLHAVDAAGCPNSAFLSFYWEEPAAQFTAEARTPWLRLAGALAHERILELRGVGEHSVSDAPTITDREREVLVWACRGKTRAETAEIIGVSERTIEWHFENAMRKLGVHNKVHAVAVAIQLRLIAP